MSIAPTKSRPSRRVHRESRAQTPTPMPIRQLEEAAGELDAFSRLFAFFLIFIIYHIAGAERIRSTYTKFLERVKGSEVVLRRRQRTDINGLISSAIHRDYNSQLASRCLSYRAPDAEDEASEYDGDSLSPALDEFRRLLSSNGSV